MQSTGDKGKAGERRLVFGCGRQFVHVKEMRIIVVVGGGVTQTGITFRRAGMLSGVPQNDHVLYP